MTPPIAFAQEIRGLQDRERENIATIAEISAEQRHQSAQLDGVLAAVNSLAEDVRELRSVMDKQIAADQTAHKELGDKCDALGKSYAADKGFVLSGAKKLLLAAVGAGALGSAAPWLKDLLGNLL